MAQIKLFGNLRQSGRPARLDLPAGTVREALEAVCLNDERLRLRLLDGGELKPYVRVMVNGHDIVHGQGLETALHAQDVVAIFPPLAGGSYRTGREELLCTVGRRVC